MPIEKVREYFKTQKERQYMLSTKLPAYTVYPQYVYSIILQYTSFYQLPEFSVPPLPDPHCISLFPSNSEFCVSYRSM